MGSGVLYLITMVGEMTGGGATGLSGIGSCWHGGRPGTKGDGAGRGSCHGEIQDWLVDPAINNKNAPGLSHQGVAAS